MVDKQPTLGPWALYTPRQRWTYLAILFLVSTSNYVDRNVISVLLEPIKAEFKVSDTMLGLLSGLAFAALYATLGLPVARWADRGNRRTIITASLVVWSGMTALCGVAQNFWQLAFARFGVGAGEAGAIPPAQSLIADYFPPDQRSRALSIFMTSATVGYLIGLIGASQIAAHFGWRAAFLAMGLPGLLIAILTATVLHEPRNRNGFENSKGAAESSWQAVRALAAKPAFLNLLIGMTLYFIYAYGAGIFIPSHLVRVLQIPLAKAGATYGGVSALSALIGTIAGGILADKLAKRERRWLAWLPALGLLLTLPIIEFSLWTNSFTIFLALNFFSGAIIAGTLPVVFAALHFVCGSARRAMAIAIVFFFANLIGLGLGPAIAGVLSDYLGQQFGPSGLRYALMLISMALLPSAWFIFRAGRNLVADMEE